MNKTDILTDISTGGYDDELGDIIEAAKARAKMIPLKPGDIVKVSDNCSPKYMQGIKCTVVKLTARKQRGHAVYLCRPVKEDEWKLSGTKMIRYFAGEYKVSDISMARDLIEKV